MARPAHGAWDSRKYFLGRPEAGWQSWYRHFVVVVAREKPGSLSGDALVVICPTATEAGANPAHDDGLIRSLPSLYGCGSLQDCLAVNLTGPTPATMTCPE